MTVLETIQDQNKEEKARAFLASHHSCITINMPQFSPVDCLMYKDGFTAGLEFKFRNVNYNDYPNIWLEESKQLALISCKDVWSAAYFCPVFNGVLYRVEVLDTIGCDRVTGGRTDRGRLDDIDLMVAVPMDKLEKIGRVF